MAEFERVVFVRLDELQKRIESLEKSKRDEEFYSVNDLMAIYNVTQHTVLAWINSNELDAMNVGKEPNKLKPRWRVTEKALNSFEKSRSL